MRSAIRKLAFAVAFVVGVNALCWLHGRRGEALYEGQLDAQRSMVRGIDRWVDADLGRANFATGSERFDGEWMFGTRMMAAVGYAQAAVEHPELREHAVAQIERCIDQLLTDDTRAFDRDHWHADPLEDLGTERDHVAYLGYLALAMSLERQLDPDTRHAGLHDRIIDHLVARAEASPVGLLETYPNERYPIDNTAFFGALAVHDRVTGEDHSELLTRLHANLEERYVDARTGLLIQSVDGDGEPTDLPRGSGTALAAYFLSFSDLALSERLYAAMQDQLLNRTFGFGTTREYARDHGGWGDVDSGPVVLGQGVSATGFTLALARIHGDRETFVATWATADLFGGPVDRDGTHFAMGGPIGDALMFALVTAQPGGWR